MKLQESPDCISGRKGYRRAYPLFLHAERRTLTFDIGHFDTQIRGKLASWGKLLELGGTGTGR